MNVSKSVNPSAQQYPLIKIIIKDQTLLSMLEINDKLSQRTFKPCF